jgi:hypothetical protein
MITLKYDPILVPFEYRYHTGRWQRNGQRRVTGSKSSFCGTNSRAHVELAVHRIAVVVAQLLLLVTTVAKQLLEQLLEPLLKPLLKLAVSSAKGNASSALLCTICTRDALL